MIGASNALVDLIGWIAQCFGLELDLAERLFVDPVDESEVVDQLQHGRD